MFIVTTAAGDEVAGCLVGFVTQTSINPPRVLVCLSVANHTYAVARTARWLGVHVLHEGDETLASLFGEHTDWHGSKFDACEWSAGPGGVPIVAGLDYFTGRIIQRYEGLGDHVGHLLDIGDESGSRATRRRVRQLGFQRLRSLEAGNPA